MLVMIDPYCSRNRIPNTIRRRPVVLRRLSWVVANYRNVFRAEHVVVNTYDELIVAAANRRLVRL